MSPNDNKASFYVREKKDFIETLMSGSLCPGLVLDAMRIGNRFLGL